MLVHVDLSWTSVAFRELQITQVSWLLHGVSLLIEISSCCDFLHAIILLLYRIGRLTLSDVTFSPVQRWVVVRYALCAFDGRMFRVISIRYDQRINRWVIKTVRIRNVQRIHRRVTETQITIELNVTRQARFTVKYSTYLLETSNTEISISVFYLKIFLFLEENLNSHVIWTIIFFIRKIKNIMVQITWEFSISEPNARC